MKPETKIHVMLYGGKSPFGGREKPLEADEVFCDATARCQLFANGKCAYCRSFGLSRCPYGTVVRTRGYTSKAKKYSQFRSKYREDPVYGALEHPRDCFLRIVGDYAYIDLPGVTLEYHENGKEGDLPWGSCLMGTNGRIELGDPGLFASGGEWVPIDEIDVDAIAKIAAYKPRAFMGGVIEKYQAATVPAFIDDIRNWWPEMYGKLVAEHPELGELEVDFRGRKAYALTLREGIEIRKGANVFAFDGKSLVCEDYSDALGSVYGIKIDNARLEIPLDDSSVIEVKDNSWVVPGKTCFA